MAWPKLIEVGGIKVPVDSWAEIKEAIQEFGGSVTVVPDTAGVHPGSTSDGGANSHHSPQVNHGDRTLIVQFIEASDRGLLTSQLSQALGKKGKGVRPALERWSRKIGLVTELNATAFEAIKRFDGRGFKMTDHYRRTAASMIGRHT